METIDFSNDTFYKYRSLNDFERFLDIVLRKRLYGAYFSELNDPLEGSFSYNNLKSYHFKEIRAKLKRTRVCSFSRKSDDQLFPNDQLMWSHYADSHRGCCIEFQLTQRNNHLWHLAPVHYSDVLPTIDGCDLEDIQKIVSTKDSRWSKENEVRAFRLYPEGKQENSSFFAIQLVAVFMGTRITLDRCQSIKRIIKSIDDKVKVYRMKEKRLFGELYPELIAEEIL